MTTDFHLNAAQEQELKCWKESSQRSGAKNKINTGKHIALTNLLANNGQQHSSRS